MRLRERGEGLWAFAQAMFLSWVVIPLAFFVFVLFVVWVVALAGGTAEVTGSGEGSYDWGTANEGPPGP